MSPTIDEISRALGLKDGDRVQKRAAKEFWPKRGNDYPLSLLPADIRKAIEAYNQAGCRVIQEEVAAIPKQIIEPEIKEVASLPEPEIKEIISLPEPEIKEVASLPEPEIKEVASLPDEVKEIANLPDEVKEIGLLKYNLVKKWREHVATADWGQGMEASQAFCLAYNAGHLLPWIYAKIGSIAESTIRSMDKKLRQNGDDYVCLCDGRGGWRKHGTTKYKERCLSNDERTAFLKCYLDARRPTIRLAYKAAKLLLSRRDAHLSDRDAHLSDRDAHLSDRDARTNVSTFPSEKTFRRFLNDYQAKHEGIICLAREGEKAWKDKYGSYITRDLSLLKPCQCLSADGKTLNFQILHPDTGRPCRMTLILFIDAYSKCPVGWQIMSTEDTMAIHGAFRNAVVNMGRYPEVVYLDNGKAFKSAHFTATNPDFEEFRGLYARVGVATVFANPYSGRSKIAVERFFKTFQMQCECLLPSYCGDSIKTQPAWMMRNEKFHKALHQAKTNNWIPNIREASAIVDAYFQWYSNTPLAESYGREHLAGRTPFELLSEGMGSGVPIEQLNWDFMWKKQLTARNGRLRHWKIDYAADFLINWSRSEPIMAAYDTSDVRTIFCYTMEGEYVGEAHPVEALHPLAAIFGDELSVNRVGQAIKKQRKELRTTKRQLIAIGAPKEMAEGLDALPFNQMAAIGVDMGSVGADSISARNTPAQISARIERTDMESASTQIAQAEIIRLEDFMVQEIKKQEQEELEPCTIDRPEYWQSELEHYEWAFAVRFEHGQRLSEQDTAFMTYFEMTEEFKDNYRGRFDDLKMLYGT